MMKYAIASIVLVVSASHASADVAVLGAAKDNTLYQSQTGAVSNALGSHLFVGTNSGGVARRALLSFDLAASIPEGSIITGATLRLHVSSANPQPLDFGLHRLDSDWGEGTSMAMGSEGQGATSSFGDATWLHRFFGGATWNTPGGDFAAMASVTTAIGDVGFYEWSAGAAMIADLQTWLDDPSMNFGWAIVGGEGALSTAKRFDSKDHANEEVRPRLEIEYRAVPTPGTALIVSLGMVYAGRRRRQ